MHLAPPLSEVITCNVSSGTLNPAIPISYWQVLMHIMLIPSHMYCIHCVKCFPVKFLFPALSLFSKECISDNNTCHCASWNLFFICCLNVWLEIYLAYCVKNPDHSVEFLYRVLCCAYCAIALLHTVVFVAVERAALCRLFCRLHRRNCFREKGVPALVNMVCIQYCVYIWSQM